MADLVPMEEKEFVATCGDRAEFVKGYMEKFGKGKDPLQLGDRIRYLWYDRKKIIKAVEASRKVAAETLQRNADIGQAAQHTVLIPAHIKQKNVQPARGESVPDVGVTVIRCQHLLAEMVQLQKEQIDIFKKLVEQKRTV